MAEPMRAKLVNDALHMAIWKRKPAQGLLWHTDRGSQYVVRRALAGQQPETPAQIMTWLEAVAQGWNVDPTPFSWGGKRAVRRQRQREHHQSLGGSGPSFANSWPHKTTKLCLQAK
jgi:hypothetical protein